MLYLYLLVTLLINSQIKPDKESGILITRFDDPIPTSSLKHKAIIRFYQLDKEGQLKLIERARFREDMFKSIRKIDFEEPIGISYYVEVGKEKIVGPYYTLFIEGAKHCQLGIVVRDNTTYIKVMKSTGKEDQEIKLVEGFHIGKDFNYFLKD